MGDIFKRDILSHLETISNDNWGSLEKSILSVIASGFLGLFIGFSKDNLFHSGTLIFSLFCFASCIIFFTLSYLVHHFLTSSLKKKMKAKPDQFPEEDYAKLAEESWLRYAMSFCNYAFVACFIAGIIAITIFGYLNLV